MVVVPPGTTGASVSVAATAMAGAGRPTWADDRGLPQSMQKRDAGSFAAPQKLHAVMQTPGAGKMAWAANIRVCAGGWQCAKTHGARWLRRQQAVQTTIS